MPVGGRARARPSRPGRRARPRSSATRALGLVGVGVDLDRAGRRRRPATGSRTGPSIAPAVPTTQGMPSWRAMIAVWLVGPPRSVTSATTSAGVEPGGVGRGEVLGDQHRRLGGRGDAGLGLADQVGDDPALDVAQVGDPLGHQAAHLGEDADELVDGRARRRPGRRRLRSCLRTAERSPLSRARPALAVSTSAAAPDGLVGLAGEAVGHRRRRVVVRRQRRVLVGEVAVAEAGDRPRARPHRARASAGPWATPGHDRGALQTGAGEPSRRW